MTLSKTRKLILSVLLSISFLFVNLVPHFAVSWSIDEHIIIEKKDSTKVVSSEIKTGNSNIEKSQTKSDSHLTYRLFSYLIKKFLEFNPLARPKN